MLHKITIVFIMMLTVSFAGMAFASDIFKWTDKDGNVHYGDRPTTETIEEPLPVASELAESLTVQARNRTRPAAIKPAGPAPEDLRAQALGREKRCATYRTRLRELLASRLSYDDHDDEVLAERERVQHQVEKYCNS